MINKFVSNIGGIEIFGIISILLFFAVFTGALGCAFCLKKRYVKHMSDLPLNDDEAPRKDIPHE